MLNNSHIQPIENGLRVKLWQSWLPGQRTAKERTPKRISKRVPECIERKSLLLS